MHHGIARVRGVLGWAYNLGMKDCMVMPSEGEVVSESGTLRHLSSQQSVGIANITIILGFQLFFDTYSVGINLAMAFLVALSVCLSPVFSRLAVVGAND